MDVFVRDECISKKHTSLALVGAHGAVELRFGAPLKCKTEDTDHICVFMYVYTYIYVIGISSYIKYINESMGYRYRCIYTQDMHVHIHIHICTYVCAYIYIYMYIHFCTYQCVYLCVVITICICTSIRIVHIKYTYVYTYVYIWGEISQQTNRSTCIHI